MRFIALGREGRRELLLLCAARKAGRALEFPETNARGGGGGGGAQQQLKHSGLLALREIGSFSALGERVCASGAACSTWTYARSPSRCYRGISWCEREREREPSDSTYNLVLCVVALWGTSAGVNYCLQVGSDLCSLYKGLHCVCVYMDIFRASEVIIIRLFASYSINANCYCIPNMACFYGYNNN